MRAEDAPVQTVRAALATVLAAGLLGTGALVAVSGAAPTAAGAAGTPGTPGTLCEQFGLAPSTDGRYVVQNNRWGADTAQCVTPRERGLALTTSRHDVPTDGAPAGYPSIYWGCHFGTCSAGAAPVRADDPRFRAVRTRLAAALVPTGAWNLSYDVWFDPQPRTDGQVTGTEVMVWLAASGGVQPVGERTGTAVLAGERWEVWHAAPSPERAWRVVSYVREGVLGTPVPATSAADLPLAAFHDDAAARGWVGPAWWLTSVQAGFEVWRGGEGLALSGFSAGPGPVVERRARTPRR